MKRFLAGLSIVCFSSIIGFGYEMPQDMRLKLQGVQCEEAREYMDWIYKYLPYPDYTAYSPEFFLENVEMSLKARKELPWGMKVPEREFRHFVLPVRTNNEMLDGFRSAYYDELKRRVDGLDMKDAILEVNRWCREKATYAPSDGRTSNPLSTISQAIGRCGEESTLLVAALRTVGIPVRQVYTPRWAHTDSNHAWVEAWADGEWFFLGACEPEPVLNLAWFNEPASRGILMHTNVFGQYDGPEECLKQDSMLTQINVTSNYAPTEELKVKVVDKDGKPIKGADVRFCIYNYADLYPVVNRPTDSKGEASLRAGLGDILVWATYGTNFGIAKGRPGEKTVTVKLDHGQGEKGEFEMEIVPPQGGGKKPVVSREAREENDRVISRADSIRREYLSTFAAGDSLLALSRGNHRIIREFLHHSGPIGERIVRSLCEKDLRDIPEEVLDDAYAHAMKEMSAATIYPVRLSQQEIDVTTLNPRVDTEALTPYKCYLAERIPASLREESRRNPEVFVNWVKDNIAIEEDGNPNHLTMDVRRVWDFRKCDSDNRDIFFVAACRSMGIPSRLDPLSGRPQYAGRDVAEGEEVWKYADFKTGEDTPVIEKGILDLRLSQGNGKEDPEYYTHFSILRIENGIPSQLEFDDGVTASSISAEKPLLDAGDYLLVSGRRLAGGEVLMKGKFFTIYPSQTTAVDLEVRHDESRMEVMGSLDAESLYYDLAEETDKSILSTVGRGFYILALIKPNDEPSAHLLNELSALSAKSAETGKDILFLFENEEAASRFDRSLYPELPDVAKFGVDKSGSVRNELMETLHLENKDENIVVLADSFNRVVFLSEGYSIGLVGRLLDALKSLNK